MTNRVMKHSLYQTRRPEPRGPRGHRTLKANRITPRRKHHQAAINPREEYANIDNLDKIHIKKVKNSITGVSILTLEISPRYRSVGECHVDLKINKL